MVPQPQITPSNQLLAFQSRNVLWLQSAMLLGATGLCFALAASSKNELQKGLLGLGATVFSGLNIAYVRPQYHRANQMSVHIVNAQLQGDAAYQSLAFYPPDPSMNQQIQVEEQPIDPWFVQLEEYPDLIQRILLSLVELKVIDSQGNKPELVGIQQMNDRIRVLVNLPTGFTVSRVAKLAEDIMSKARLDRVPEIYAVEGGCAIDLVVDVEYANPEAPTVVVPEGEAIAVEVDDAVAKAREEQSKLLPDGARLIEISELKNENKYPVINVVAGQGSGKTATMGAILSSLDGNIAVASPKPLSSKMQAIADLIFGFNPTVRQWRYFGTPEDARLLQNDRDLSYFLNKDSKLAGSMLDFVWACHRESANRQLFVDRDQTPWRCFFDEAAQTYLTGFNDPLNDPEGKAAKLVQGIIATCNKDAYLNYRAQRVQLFFGTQVATVESLGLKNFSAARDEAWALFPGKAAIIECKRLEKYQLAAWLDQRVKDGFGIAIMVKQNKIVEVLNMPTIEILDKFSKDDK